VFERPRAGERAVLVRLGIGAPADPEDIQEFEQLARSAGAIPVANIGGRRDRPDPRFFVGSGKADEIRAIAAAENAEVVLFDHPLSPSQERNLEKLIERRVLDRSGLILDIFAQRARSHEGKLEVELAQLKHLATRLVRGWTHLERQKGGIGLRGPGETQLETDRRLIGERVKMLRTRLTKLRKQHETQRRSRGRNKTFSVSLVGYTNAGKSTLFNTLTKAGVYVANQLFATLDTTSRRLYLGPDTGNVVVSDTVGFVRELPHQLVAAFRATLEETIHADLLLHVVDGASPVRMEQIDQVNEVLREIGADHIPQILVWNKIDAAGLEPGIERDEYGKIGRVFISARSGAGLDLLRDAIVEAAGNGAVVPGVDEQEDEVGSDFASDVQPAAADLLPVTSHPGPH